MRRQQSSSLRNSFHISPRNLLILFFVLLALAAVPAAQAQPFLMLDGDLTAGELEVGGHLDAAVVDGVPLAHYSVLLLDESDQVVASALDLQADNAGWIDYTRLWTRTGVVGCDPGVVHDPLNYQFKSFKEADSLLGGRTFTVQLIEGVDRSRVLDAEPLDLRAITDFIEGYPSDGAGCLRTRMFMAEPLHLSIAHQGGGFLPLQIYLVDATALPGPGETIVDVRGVPQAINVPAGADPWVELMWLAPVAGDYRVIVRPIGSTGPYDPNFDLMIETGIKHAGATANQCGGVCPP